MIIANPKIRILICDDQAIVVEGLYAILSSVPDFEVVGTAQNGDECIEIIPKLKPDLVLMDLKMPIMNGIQATKYIHDNFSEIRVLVLTTYDSDGWVLDAIRNGAAGYLLKDTPKEILVNAIIGTVNGRSHIDPQVAGKVLNFIAREPSLALPDQQLLSQLSEREREVLHLLARGLTNGEIAKILFLSDGTVKNYISNIYPKIGVTDRTQAALFAIKAGLG
jgi:two-component system, NarL family, response regulator LiaR